MRRRWRRMRRKKMKRGTSVLPAGMFFRNR
jgi:hypothetical protein